MCIRIRSPASTCPCTTLSTPPLFHHHRHQLLYTHNATHRQVLGALGALKPDRGITRCHFVIAKGGKVEDAQVGGETAGRWGVGTVGRWEDGETRWGGGGELQAGRRRAFEVGRSWVGVCSWAHSSTCMLTRYRYLIFSLALITALSQLLRLGYCRRHPLPAAHLRPPAPMTTTSHLPTSPRTDRHRQQGLGARGRGLRDRQVRGRGLRDQQARQRCVYVCGGLRLE